MATYDKRHLLKSAYNYTQAGQWDRALEEYRKMTRLFPDDANVHSMIADLLAKKNDGQAAAAEYLEAARLHRAAEAPEKELQAIRKALRVKAGDEAATQALAGVMERGLAKAQERKAQGALAEAEALCQALLDAEPGSLPVNRLMDEVRAAKLQAQASQAAAPSAPESVESVAAAAAADATSEVLARLAKAVDAYLLAEDFDSAIETLLVMLKLDPGRQELSERLSRTQEQLENRRQAQLAWQAMQEKQARELHQVKQAELSAKEQEAWKEQEQALHAQLAAEQQAVEEAARQELGIVEKAVAELRKRQDASALGPEAVLGAPGVPMALAFSAEDEARLKALLSERSQLEQRLASEQAESQKRLKELEEQRAREASMLNHAIELAKQEAEAQAKAAAVAELEAKLAKEREEHARQLEEERRRSREHEEALQAQLRDLMREEMARMRQEVQAKASEEVRRQVEEERRRRQSLEAETAAKMNEAERRASAEKDLMEAAKQKAEEAARKEREAIALLKDKEAARKEQLVEEALKRRATRTAGPGEARSQVMKASRKISDALHAAATKHLGQDSDALLEQARRYLKQDLLLDAMRICQKVTEADPSNEKVKELLREIYVRKGL